MLRLRHIVRLPLPHLLVLVLLVLGVAMKPVLASVGEVHELQHDPSGLHLHHDDGDSADAEAHTDNERMQPETATTPGDSSDLLHELLHFAHCCGQSPPSVPAIATTLPEPAIASTRPAMTTVPAPTHRTHGVFRPPIQG